MNFNAISTEIHTSSLKQIHLNMSSEKWRSFCLDLNVLARVDDEAATNIEDETKRVEG